MVGFAVVRISDKHPSTVTYTLGLECAMEERVCSYLTYFKVQFIYKRSASVGS